MLMGKFNKRCEHGIYQSLFSEHLPFLDRCTIQQKENVSLEEYLQLILLM